jgi:hypothetical protein
MLGSTLTLPLAAGDKVLPSVNSGEPFAMEYYLREALVSWRVQVRHSTFVKGGQTYDRHNVTMTKKTFATTTVPEFDHIVSFTHSVLPGDTYVELGNALIGWLETSVNVKAASNATLIKLLGWES